MLICQTLKEDSERQKGVATPTRWFVALDCRNAADWLPCVPLQTSLASTLDGATLRACRAERESKKETLEVCPICPSAHLPLHLA